MSQRLPHTCRILLVDDNVDARETLREILEIDGFLLSEAATGPEALDAARKERPDLIVLDIGLPELDGYQVAGRLRADPDLHATPIIALTGYGQDADRRRAEQSGFDAHLTKPVDLNKLRRLIRTLC